MDLRSPGQGGSFSTISNSASNALPPLAELKSQQLTELDQPKANLLTGKEKPALWTRLYPYPSKGQMYYCFMWGRGHLVYGKLHLAGGAVGSALADARAAELAAAMGEALPLLELLALLRGFSNVRPGRKALG